MPRTGIVAFLDILGYQNIVDNNQIETMAILLKNTLSEIPDKAIKDLTERLRTTENKDMLKKVLDQMKCLLISDSIVLALPIEIDGIKPTLIWFSFLAYVSKLMRTSFDEGLPLRGAIDYGEFYFKGNIFAGKPIIDSYRISEKLEFCGCIFTENGYEKIMKEKINGNNEDFFKEFLYSYYAPLKTGEKKVHLVNWFNPFKGWGKEAGDLTQFIFESFHAHNKDVSSKVVQKLQNTERLLRFCLLKSNSTAG